MKLKWLIYCRVSSKKQVREWNGLSAQESKCRRYAKDTLWIDVEEVFYDDWVSGGIFERKSIQALLRYIDDNSKSNYIVIFEDLNRLSRDVQVHNLLRNEFRKRNIELQCPNFQFDETPEWDFKENISVAVSQYERKKNTQRVISRQTERLKDWYWCFRFPLWYKSVKNKWEWWKVMIKDESNYKIIQNTLNKYARDELNTLNEVCRYLHKKWIELGTIRNGKVYNTSSISRMMRNILYTGYLEVKSKSITIPLQKAKHPALISMNTYKIIQAKIDKEPTKLSDQVIKNKSRNDLNNDFPLRGFLYCEESKQFLSWAWSKWKNKQFPYYTFPRKSSLHGKSLNRNTFHNQFENILQDIQPKEELIQALEKAIELVSEMHIQDKWEHKKILKSKLQSIDTKIDKFIERIWVSSSDVVINKYEQEIETLEKEKTQISQKIETEVKNVRTPLNRKTRMVRDSLRIWKDGDLENKKALLKNIFPEWIPINKKKQVWTPTLSLIYQSFSHWESGFSNLVGYPGLEPRTFPLKGGCSTNWANIP